MAENAAEVQSYLPMETAPQASDVLKVRGDGNCFFRCLSVNITGTESSHRQKALQKAIVKYMKQHEENLPENYLEKSNMGKDRVCSGSLMSKSLLRETSSVPKSVAIIYRYGSVQSLRLYSRYGCIRLRILRTCYELSLSTFRRQLLTLLAHRARSRLFYSNAVYKLLTYLLTYAR